MMKYFLTLFTLLAMMFSGAAMADEPEISLRKPSIFGGSFEFALDGYDTVSYFTAGEPQKGNEKFKTVYKGATWLFRSAENLAAFEAAPSKYAPAFGNYCAYAMANGSLAAGDPLAWHIEDGVLYLNYSKSVQKKWKKDIPGNIAAANKVWPQILKK